MPDLALDVALKLLAVIALAYVSLALVKRYSLGGGLAKREGPLQVLDSVALGPNRAIYLVRALDKRLVVGVTANQVTTLAAWDLGGTLADATAGSTIESVLAAFPTRPS